MDFKSFKMNSKDFLEMLLNRNSVSQEKIAELYTIIEEENANKADLIVLAELINHHEANKNQLQDKLAKPSVLDMDCIDSYKILLEKTIQMIEFLTKDLTTKIKALNVWKQQ